nr:VWFA and cache domain-containing protein 1-like [Salvelinus alpinus]
MARRVGGEGSVILTRIPYTNWNKNARLHWCNFMAVFWSFVAVLSLLCCGFCGAETEFSILEEAQVLAVQMKKLSSQELGVFTMQRIFNSFVYTEKTSNGETEVQQLAKKIREKFNRYLDVVNRNKQVVEASYTAQPERPLHPPIQI